MITLHDDIEQGTPEWHAAREGKFTGSNAHKLLSSFGAGDHARSVEGSFGGNFYTARGHLLEDEALELYHQITRERIKHCGFVTNDRYPSCLYSPDGLTGERVLEVKCFTEIGHLALYNANDWLQLPKKILAQIHYGMMICEKRKARLIIYNPRLDPKQAFKFIDIPYSQTIHTRLSNILKEN